MPPRPTEPAEHACEGKNIDLGWARSAKECRVARPRRDWRDAGTPEDAWPQALRVVLEPRASSMKPDESLDVDVWLANVGAAPLSLTLSAPATPAAKGARSDDARLRVYPLDASGQRLDVPSSMLALLSASDDVVRITLTPGGWARGVGTFTARGFVADKKSSLGEKLAPLAPGKYRLGVSLLASSKTGPSIDAFVEIR